MLGLVLAAGAGRRLRPHTDHRPKALVEVADGTTILDVCLRNLAAVDLRRVVIVVGYARAAIESRRADLERRHGVELELVVNERAEEWNNAYSLWTARDHLTEGALLVNGDTLHPSSVEEELLARRGPELLLALDTTKRLADEEMKVRLDAAGGLERIHKGLPPESADGEYIGVSLIEPVAAPRVVEALRATWERDPHLYYEDGYQEFADRGGRVGAAEIGQVDWVEVDDTRDLQRARGIACRC